MREWIRLHNEELRDLNCAPHTKKNVMGRAYDTYGTRRCAYRVLVGRSEVKRQLGIPRRRWEDNIKIYLRKVGWRGMDSIDLPHDRDRLPAFVIAVINFWFHKIQGVYWLAENMLTSHK
jgi:hypothetical protein